MHSLIKVISWSLFHNAYLFWKLASIEQYSILKICSGKPSKYVITEWLLKYLFGEHIPDTYITETDTTDIDNLSHNIIDIFIIKS